MMFVSAELENRLPDKHGAGGTLAGWAFRPWSGWAMPRSEGSW